MNFLIVLTRSFVCFIFKVINHFCFMFIVYCFLFVFIVYWRERERERCRCDVSLSSLLSPLSSLLSPVLSFIPLLSLSSHLFSFLISHSLAFRSSYAVRYGTQTLQAVLLIYKVVATAREWQGILKLILLPCYKMIRSLVLN